jgi:hypothetical protein
MQIDALSRRMMRLLISTVVLAGLATANAAEPAWKISPLENGVVCVQTTNVTAALTGELAAELTNQFSGLVLDLRFASGPKNFSPVNFISLPKTPLVILVNAQTRGAAADWAAQLRTDDKAILIGGTNIAGNIAPDITVAVTPVQEKNFQQDPFAVSEKNSIPTINPDLGAFIDHTSEAELVRRRVKDGDDAVADAPRAEPALTIIRDPALARAVDLLKALAVLKQARG